ncbi:MAG: hypothetical protein ACRDBY_12860 [Cetobacterium sp.]
MKEKVMKYIDLAMKSEKTLVESTNGGSILVGCREVRVYTNELDRDFHMIATLINTNEYVQFIQKAHPSFISATIESFDKDGDLYIRTIVRLCNINDILSNKYFINFAEEVTDRMVELFEDIDIGYRLYEHGDALHSYSISCNPSLFDINIYKLKIALLSYVDYYSILYKESLHPFSDDQQWLAMEIDELRYNTDFNEVILKFRLLEI